MVYSTNRMIQWSSKIKNSGASLDGWPFFSLNWVPRVLQNHRTTHPAKISFAQPPSWSFLLRSPHMWGLHKKTCPGFLPPGSRSTIGASAKTCRWKSPRLSRGLLILHKRALGICLHKNPRKRSKPWKGFDLFGVKWTAGVNFQLTPAASGPNLRREKIACDLFDAFSNTLPLFHGGFIFYPPWKRGSVLEKARISINHMWLICVAVIPRELDAIHGVQYG